ncbi:MAG: hypothetical protein RLZZ141_520 [Pseudomonadota bacterium]|jgi:hypothetical protein
MSTSRSSSYRRSGNDHFEPDIDSDPAAQRRLRGQLEQIDYTVFAANREVISRMLGFADAEKFQRLAAATALARAAWVAEALTQTQVPNSLNSDQVTKLRKLREAYEELSEAYEATRRMVERGYLPFKPAANGFFKA